MYNKGFFLKFFEYFGISFKTISIYFVYVHFILFSPIKQPLAFASSSLFNRTATATTTTTTTRRSNIQKYKFPTTFSRFICSHCTILRCSTWKECIRTTYDLRNEERRWNRIHLPDTIGFFSIISLNKVNLMLYFLNEKSRGNQ